MAEPFSSQDILSLRNDTGMVPQAPTLNSRQRAYVDAKAQETLYPAMDMYMKASKFASDQRASELAYQAAMLSFDQKKEDIYKSQEADAALESRLGELNSIFNDKKTSATDKQQQLNSFALNNYKSLNDSSYGGILLGTMGNFLTGQMKLRDEEKKLQDSSLNFKKGLLTQTANLATRPEDVEKLNDLTTRLDKGESVPDGEIFNALASTTTSRRMYERDLNERKMRAEALQLQDRKVTKEVENYNTELADLAERVRGFRDVTSPEYQAIDRDILNLDLDDDETEERRNEIPSILREKGVEILKKRFGKIRTSRGVINVDFGKADTVDEVESIIRSALSDAQFEGATTLPDKPDGEDDAVYDMIRRASKG
jgi:hypothetical protein